MESGQWLGCRTVSLSVEVVSVAAVRSFLARYSVAGGDPPWQQWPAWASVRSQWRPLFLGWSTGPAWSTRLGSSTDDAALVGVGLALLRPLPRTRWSVAYLPEGPVVDWSRVEVADALGTLARRLRAAGAVSVTIGPRLAWRRWSAATVKAAIAAGGVDRLRDIPPSHVHGSTQTLRAGLQGAGWRQYEAPAAGFGGRFQPRYGYEVSMAGGTEDAWAATDQAWRRNVRRAQRLGVEVRAQSSSAGVSALPELHRLMGETGRRENFQPRELSYYQRMWTAYENEPGVEQRIYLARHNGITHAAAWWVRTGQRVSYTYGGSSDAGRDLRPSNAMQWQMLTDSVESGASAYDLRGIGDGLSADDPHLGLLRFKLGLGGDCVEYLGEWDLPLRPQLARAVSLVLNRRR